GTGPSARALSLLPDYFEEAPELVQAACQRFSAEPSAAFMLHNVVTRRFLAPLPHSAQDAERWRIGGTGLGGWRRDASERGGAAGLAAYRERHDEWAELGELQAA